MALDPTARPTLVGVATGSPDGGVAVVRLSGPDVGAIVEAIAGALRTPRRLSMRAIRLEDGVEQGLVVWMPGPGSFTGEDVAELHVHAGERNVRAVLETCLRAGAVAAGPGDFSRRAFEHGRLTLDQAEGIAALIGAQTEAALAQARRLIAGEVGQAVDARREAVADLRAEIEANLDFPEDVDPRHVVRWRDELRSLGDAVGAWLDGFEAGRRARERLRIAIAGPPNAGKSSLFNALVGRERAIVSATPGTTRDYVDADLSIGAFTFTLTDTAGLRRANNDIEAQGIRRAREQHRTADLVLWLEPADAPDETPPQGSPMIRVETKRDLGARRPDWIGTTVAPSATDIADLEAALAAWAATGRQHAWIGLARHRDCAAAACDALHRATDLIAVDQPLELVAFELQIADARLCEITGRSALGPIAEDLLDRIFSRFCIGK
jgi:tRNA modification GTPase